MENEFGNLVQHYREKAGFTQDELAAKLDVSQQTVAKWEAGKAYPRPAAFAKLNQLLAIPSGKIMDLYANSKGARSSSVRVEDLSLTRSVQEPRFDRHSWRPENYTNELRKITEEVRPLLTEQKNSSWSKTVSGGSLSWYVHYMDDEILVEFTYVDSPRTLHDLLRVAMREMLWKMATLRAHLKDHRSYLLIVVLPGYIGTDLDGGETGYIQNEIVLRRYPAEAALLDISIFVVNSVKQVQALMTAHGPDDEFSW